MGLDMLRPLFPSFGVAVLYEGREASIAVGRSSTEHLCVIAGSFDDDIEQRRSFAQVDLSAVAESVDVRSDRRVVELGLRPETDERV